MFESPVVKRIVIDGLLWVVIAVCCWFALTRHFVAFFAVSGRWQTPGVSRVYVGRVQENTNDTFNNFLITVNKDGSQKVSKLFKKELIGVKPGDKIWLIHPPFVALAEPSSYRFTILRLFKEFSEIFLLISGCWLFLRFRSRLGKPYDAYEGPKKATAVTYVVPDPNSWGRSKLLINEKNQEENS